MIKNLLGSPDSFIPHSRVQFQYFVVTASDIENSSLLNRNPLKHSKKSKIFFAISLNLLIYYGHWYL